MKTRILGSWKFWLALAAMPLIVAGFQGPTVDAEAGTVPADDQTAATNVASTNEAPEIEAVVPVVTTNVIPPAMPDLKFSAGSAEIVRMAQSGVSEDVMLAYIAKASNRFNLSSDQIIYLNDLGVSGPVITSMIHTDAQLEASLQAAYVAMQPVTPVEQPVTNDANVSQPAEMGGYPPNQYMNYTEPVTQPVNYQVTGDATYYYDTLAPYGSWYYVTGYGMCWQPTAYVRNPGWRPYLDRGRWVYTDCGWYWHSDYSWGWAPYHYGRWFCDANRGWLWMPNQTWGPAWVTWRSSSDYCGWAPLPPAAPFTPGVGFSIQSFGGGLSFSFGLGFGMYNFIPVARMCDYSPSRYCVYGAQANRVFNEAVVVNNLTVEGRRVYNRGIDPRRVEEVTRTPVRRAEVRETARDGSRRGQFDRLTTDGDRLVLYRPPTPTTVDQTGGSQRTAVTRGGGSVRNGGGTTVTTAGTPATTPRSGTMTTGPVTPSGEPTRPSRVQVYTRPGNTTQPATSTPRPTTASSPTVMAESYPPNSIVISGRRTGRDSQPATGNSEATLRVPNQTTDQTGVPANTGARVPTQRGAFSTAQPTQSSTPSSTSYRVTAPRTFTPPTTTPTTPDTTYQAPNNNNANRFNGRSGQNQNAGPFVRQNQQPAQSSSQSSQPNTQPSTTSRSFGGFNNNSFSRGNGNGNQISSSTTVTPSAPVQSQPAFTVPSRGSGNAFSGANTAPANNNPAPAYSLPASRSFNTQPAQSAPASAPSYSRPAPAAAPTPAPSPAPSQPSAPSRSSSSSSSDSSGGRFTPMVPSQSSGGSGNSGNSGNSGGRGGR